MRNLFKLALLGSVMIPGSAMAQDNITLNWALWDWTATAYYEPLIEAYEAANPHVTIEYTDLGSADYNQMLMTQLSGGASDIDIVTIKDVPGYAQLVSTNSLLDLNEALGGVSGEGYGGLIEALTVNDTLYALPFRSDFWVIYYNKDLFDAAGVDYPTNDMTWEQYDELARAVTSGFGNDKVYGSHLHTWRSTVQLPAILDGEHTLIAEDYAFLAPWYERALALQDEGVIQSYASLRTSNTHYSGPFFSAQIASIPMGTWFIGTQIERVRNGESLATNWGIVSFPHPEGVAPGATAAQVTSLGVNPNSEHVEATLDFIQWVSGPEGAAVIAQTGTLPALRDETVIDTIRATDGFPSDDASAEALITTAAYLELPVDLDAARIELVLNRAHDEIMTNNTSIEDGIAEMNTGVAEILGN
jgi:multiple sugar transport system substrate-binding protein